MAILTYQSAVYIHDQEFIETTSQSFSLTLDRAQDTLSAKLENLAGESIKVYKPRL